MKDREIQCVYYLAEHDCEIGHDGTFRKACQKCPDYTPLRGAKPARKNLKRDKLHKARKKDYRDWD